MIRMKIKATAMEYSVHVSMVLSWAVMMSGEPDTVGSRLWQRGEDVLVLDRGSAIVYNVGTG